MGTERITTARRVDDIDWDRWAPSRVATLVFVVTGSAILLIRKKRGLGAGKITGPGGCLEAGESPAACAARELAEELCVAPLELRAAGELSFQFVDGLAMRVFVFATDGCLGEPRETPEAVPLWSPLDRIPYGEMWADDALWLPLLLRGTRFAGRFVFDGDAMLDAELQTSGS